MPSADPLHKAAPGHPKGHIRPRRIDEAGPARFPWGLARNLSAADIATARNWLIRRIADRTVEIMHRDETP